MWMPVVSKWSLPTRITWVLIKSFQENRIISTDKQQIMQAETTEETTEWISVLQNVIAHELVSLLLFQFICCISSHLLTHCNQTTKSQNAQTITKVDSGGGSSAGSGGNIGETPSTMLLGASGSGSGGLALSASASKSHPFAEFEVLGKNANNKTAFLFRCWK